MAIAAREDAWAIVSAIDICDCNPECIRDTDSILRFVAEFCELMEMKWFGDNAQCDSFSQASLFVSPEAGISAFWGPLHSGANVAALEMV